jgi:hypothetical protein
MYAGPGVEHCMYIHTYIHTHVQHTGTYTNASGGYLCVCVCIYIHAPHSFDLFILAVLAERQRIVCIHVCMCVYIYVCVCISEAISTLHACTFIHMRYTRTHTYTPNTHTNIPNTYDRSKQGPPQRPESGRHIRRSNDHHHQTARITVSRRRRCRLGVRHWCRGFRTTRTCHYRSAVCVVPACETKP